jgi:hypothetical protein
VAGGRGQRAHLESVSAGLGVVRQRDAPHAATFAFVLGYAVAARAGSAKAAACALAFATTCSFAAGPIVRPRRRRTRRRSCRGTSGRCASTGFACRAACRHIRLRARRTRRLSCR